MPGVGLVMGRAALREIRETGEGGRSRALWAVGINAAITISLLAAIVFSWVSGGPQAGTDLMAYHAGQCFDVPGSPGKPRLADDFVAPVKRRSCSGPHEAEVVGRWVSGRSFDSSPGDAAVQQRALAGCARQLTGYAADAWRWPASLRLGFVGDTAGSEMFGSRSHVLCYVTGVADGTVRQDSSDATPAQTAYLAAVDGYTVAALQTPGTRDAVSDFDGWRTYTAAMATAAARERDALRAGHWPSAAAQPLAALEAIDQRAAAHWRKAAAAPGAQEVDQEVAAARADDGYRQATAALRRALGLPSDAPRGHTVTV